MRSKVGSGAQISTAEWLVMECLWANGPMYMADIVNILKEQTDWSRTTVLTLASRLEKKGYLGTERSSKAYLYVPLVSRKAAVSERVESFVKETFSGDYYQLAKLIAEGSKLSVAEEKKLRARFKPLKNDVPEAVDVAVLGKLEAPLAKRILGTDSNAEPLLKEKFKNKTKNKEGKINSNKDKKANKKSKKK